MGASGKTFLHFRMEEEHYNDLPREYREQMELRRTEIEGEEYPDDPIWLELKKNAKESFRHFKALSNYEYDKRHNFKNK